MPAQLALFDQSVGLARTHVIGTLAELGVADELARGRPPPTSWRPAWA